MTDLLHRFVSELRADHELAGAADEVAIALACLDLEGDGVPDAATMWEAVLWIVGQSCAVDERLKALHKLFSLPRGPTRVTLRRCGDSIIVERIS
jgi:hypothetical protein